MTDPIDTSDGIEVYDRINQVWRPWCPDCAGTLYLSAREGQVVGWVDDLYNSDREMVGDPVREPLHIAEGDTCWSCADVGYTTTWTEEYGWVTDDQGGDA